MKSETITLDGKEVSSVTRDEESLVAKLGGKEKHFERRHNVVGALIKNGNIDLNYHVSGLLAGLDIDHVSRNYHYNKELPETISTQSQGKNLLAQTLTWNQGLINSVKSDTKTTQYQYDSLGHLKKAGTYEYTHCKGPDGAQYLCQGEDWFREGPGKTLFTSVEVPKIISGEAENAKTLQVSVNGELKHHFPVKGQKRWSAEVDLPAGQASTICARAYDFEGLFEEDVCTVNVPTQESTSEYDKEGRLIRRSYTNGKTQTFQWNAWGHLEKMVQKNPEGNNYTFTAQYDPLGRRIQTTFKDQTTTYVYNPEVEFETLGHQDTTGTYWHHQSPQGLEAIEDSQGTLTTLINNAQHHGVGHIQGQKVVHYKNPLPYGKIQGQKGPHQTYRGKPYDPTGLIYMGARYYDPEEAQFLSPDPYGYTGNTNLYAYANGDPINYYDPDGRLYQKAHEVIAPQINDAWLIGSTLQYVNMEASINLASNMIVGQEQIGNHEVVQAVVPEYLLDLTFGSAAKASKGALNFVRTKVKDFALRRQRSIAAKHIKDGRRLLKEIFPDVPQSYRNQVINAFEHESFRVKKIKNPTIDYRYYDDIRSFMGGRWTTPHYFGTPLRRIEKLALIRNEATKTAKAIHKPGSIVFEGRVAHQTNVHKRLRGGPIQHFYVKGPKMNIKNIEL